jgi:hypothetical protein
MRHLPVLFTKNARVGVVAYAALPANHLLAQEIANPPRVISDVKLSECINRIGQTIVRHGTTKVPFTVKIEVSSEAASDQQARVLSNPAIAGCIDGIARLSVRDGVAKVPFVIRVTPAPKLPALLSVFCPQSVSHKGSSAI